MPLCLLGYADFMLRVGIWLILGGWFTWRLCLGAHAAWSWYAESRAKKRRLDGPFKLAFLLALVAPAGCAGYRRKPLPKPRMCLELCDCSRTPCHGLNHEQCRDYMRSWRRK